MEKTLRVLNKMVRDGVIETYAIGGAIAAIFYVEPFETSDLDIFFAFQTAQNDLLILAPIYDYLAGLGYHSEGEFVNIKGWHVQFLPVFNSLIEEAVARAQEIKFKRTKTRIVRAEYLVAIMLATGRPKDHARIIQFLDEDAVNFNELEKLIRRHGLHMEWESFLRKCQK
ncbi:MAG: hypothetical protein NVSMB56_02820 [Pyrinomonadaceae bacterium]